MELADRLESQDIGRSESMEEGWLETNWAILAIWAEWNIRSGETTVDSRPDGAVSESEELSSA